MYEGLGTILATKGPEIKRENGLAAEKLCECLARLVRQFWNDDSEAKRVYQLALSLAIKPAYQAIGWVLLRKITEEMSPQISRPRPQHLRNAQVFKDDYLPLAFKTASQQFLLQMQFTDWPLAISVVKLLVSVLSFDTSEENGVWKCVMISSDERKRGNWTLLEQVETPALVYQLYCHCHERLMGKDAALCFQFLALLASVQRYFYANSDLRVEILKAIVSGVMIVINQSIGLSDPASLLELCKLLHALASASVHSDLLDSELSQSFLTCVFTLTVNLLASNTCDNAVFFLMQFWSRLVPSVLHFSDHSQALKAAILKLIEDYWKAAALLIEQQDLDRELLDDAMVSTVSEMVRADSVTIGLRCLQELKSVAGSCLTTGGNLQLLQFLIKFASMMMAENRNLTSKKAHFCSPGDLKPSSALSPAEAELLGHLSAELFKICLLSRQSPANKSLILACLGFLRSFQVVFLGPNAEQEVVNVCTYLQGALNVGEIAEMWIELDLHYLRLGATAERPDQELISEAISAFSGLIQGSKCAKIPGSREELVWVGPLCIRPAFISELLAALASKQVFVPYDPALLSSRTQLFSAAGKLLFWALRWVEGLQGEDWLKAHFQAHNTGDLPGYQAWLYESIGLVQAISLSCDFTTWTEWFLDGPAADLLGKLQAAAGNISLACAVLKLTAECSHNRVNRIIFPQHSILGGELARVLTTVLSVYLTSTFLMPVDSPYEQRYRPFRRAVRTITNLISGRYCNMALFLSSDTSFRAVFEAALRCLRQIPMEDLLAYQKQFQCVWDMVDIATQYEALVPLLLSLETEDLERVLELCREGLQSLSNAARISSANTINNLIAFISKPLKPALQPIFDQFRLKTDLYMKRLLKSVLIVVLDGFLANTSLISKALLGLINHQQVYFQGLMQEVLQAQEPHVQESLQPALADLLKGTDFVWWQVQPVQSLEVVMDNMKGAKVFGENLGQLIAKVGRITWC